jgi:hypothetical protein
MFVIEGTEKVNVDSAATCQMLCYALCISLCYNSRHIECPVHVAVVSTFLMTEFQKMYRFFDITNVRVGSTNAVVTSAACLFNTIREDTPHDTQRH